MYTLRNLALAFASLAAAAGVASAADAAAATAATADKADTIVKSLTKDTFKDFIKEHDLVLAEFFAPWCGHCKSLAPEYETAAGELADKNIPLVKVDCTEEMDLCREFGVQGYPTLKVFRGLDDVKPYDDARKAPSLVSFMIKQSLPAVTTVNTAEELEDFKALDKVTVVGYYAVDDKASSEVFTKIAEELRNSYPFAATSESSLAEAEGAKLPAIALYKDFDEKKDIYTDKFDNTSIKAFIKNAATPLIGVMAPETYISYMSAGIPLAYIFAETKEERDEFAAMLKPVAKEHKGKINIVTIDAKAFGPHAKTLNLIGDKFPAFAIQDIENNLKFPFDQSKKITEKAIAAFVSDVLEGKIEPSIKSQPIPEKQDGPVTIVVAKNYDEIVNNDEKDVLVEFYAPWCGHCKALAPKYDDLGKLYQNDDDFSSKVTIAKIDATANDVPEDIAGFPTIKLYPAGSKTEPVDFTGKRTVEELANFVRDNGKHQVDAWAAAQAGEEKEDKPSESQSASSTTSSSSSSASGKANDEGAKTATESDAAAPSESAKVESDAKAGEAPSHEEL